MIRSLPLAALLLLAACAKQIPEAVDPAGAGFLLGLWQGFIFPIAFLLGLIIPEIAVYAVPNNGWPYDLGYFLGIVVFGVGSWRGKKVVVREKIVREPRVVDHKH
jgi:hypothetical protein